MQEFVMSLPIHKLPAILAGCQASESQNNKMQQMKYRSLQLLEHEGADLRHRIIKDFLLIHFVRAKWTPISCILAQESAGAECEHLMAACSLQLMGSMSGQWLAACKLSQAHQAANLA